MTKIITRYFESAEGARATKREMVLQERVSPRIVRIYDAADGLVDALTAAKVEAATAEAYAKRLKKGGAVMLVEAGAKPLGIARITRELTAKMGAVDLGDLVEEVEVKDPVRPRLSVFTDHPLLLTRPRDPDTSTYHMANWPLPLISRRKPFKGTVIPRHGRMASWPIGLLLPGNTRYGRFPFDYLIPGHKHMANWPIGHLIPGHKFMAKFPFAHLIPGHKFMAKFPFGHLIPGHKFQAKFPFGHLIPGHPRMANWPFPLLINGKQGTNSLVPGQKFMAKWPFAHLIPGHKFQAKFPFGHIVPGHKHMAKFPFGHIVPGHRHMARFPFGHIIPGHKHQANFPFGLIVPGHKYMANWILPHTKKKAG